MHDHCTVFYGTLETKYCSLNILIYGTTTDFNCFHSVTVFFYPPSALALVVVFYFEISHILGHIPCWSVAFQRCRLLCFQKPLKLGEIKIQFKVEATIFELGISTLLIFSLFKTYEIRF